MMQRPAPALWRQRRARTGRAGVALRCRGFSLIEATIAMLILGGLLAASVNVVGAMSRVRLSVYEQQMARLLAEDLMAEVLAAAYKDPEEAGGLGIDAGESAADRTTFDDVDDYHNWTATATRRDGSSLNTDGSWTLGVRVEWVEPASPATTSAAETGVKRITITAARGGRQLASLSAIRTEAWESAR